jgi:hypothetical protein
MWLIIGILIGLAIAGLLLVIQRRRLEVRWYEWVLVVAGVLIGAFGLQNVMGAGADHWPASTGLTFSLVFILPGAVLLLVGAGFPLWRYMAARKSRRGG